MAQDTALAREHAVNPMLELYPPPQHLRGKPAAIERAAELYAKALSRFDEASLTAGWQAVVESHNFWCWPSLPEVKAACERAERQLRGPEKRGCESNPVQAAVDDAWAYRKRFMKTTALGKRAEAGGWGDRLAEYVFEAAYLQAQHIHGVSPKGWGEALMGPKTLPPEERKELAAEAIRRAEEQAGRGHVKVHVPHRLAEVWRREAGCEVCVPER